MSGKRTACRNTRLRNAIVGSVFLHASVFGIALLAPETPTVALRAAGGRQTTVRLADIESGPALPPLATGTAPRSRDAQSPEPRAGGANGSASFLALAGDDTMPAPLVPLDSLLKFPERAALLGIRAARVIAELEIDRDGIVRAVRVRTSAGRDFDAEVLAKLPDVRFSPARRDGKPIAVRALIPIRFRLR